MDQFSKAKKEGRFGHNIINTSSAIINNKSILPPNMVFTIAKATAAASPTLEILPCDPPLNAKKPKNKMNPPRAHFCTRENKNTSIYQVTYFSVCLSTCLSACLSVCQLSVCSEDVLSSLFSVRLSPQSKVSTYVYWGVRVGCGEGEVCVTPFIFRFPPR